MNGVLNTSGLFLTETCEKAPFPSRHIMPAPIPPIGKESLFRYQPEYSPLNSLELFGNLLSAVLEHPIIRTIIRLINIKCALVFIVLYLIDRLIVAYCICFQYITLKILIFARFDKK